MWEYRSRPGFGLIEALIASGIIVMVAAASVGLSTLILRNTVNFDDQIIVSNLASEAIEIAHWVRDYNISDGAPDTEWNKNLKQIVCNLDSP